MMLPTHALVGMLLALPVAVVSPELAPVAFAAGFLGGAFPDLDMYAGHRKTLHYPVYYAVLAGALLPVAALAPTAATVGLALFVLAAAVHSVSDVAGGGLELRPWEATSDRAVYDHFRGRWIPPRYWVGYDGSPQDFLLAAAAGTPLLLALDGVLRSVVLASLGVAAAYALVRRVLPSVAERLVAALHASRVPDEVVTYLPARYHGPQTGHAVGTVARFEDGD